MDSTQFNNLLEIYKHRSWRLIYDTDRSFWQEYELEQLDAVVSFRLSTAYHTVTSPGSRYTPPSVELVEDKFYREVEVDLLVLFQEDEHELTAEQRERLGEVLHHNIHLELE